MGEISLKKVLKIAACLEDSSCDSGDQDHGLCLAVLDRGFVYYGRMVTSSDWLTITEALNVRKWGTTEGLGQLALKGPTKETVLDRCGTVKCPLRAVIIIIPVMAGGKWS